MKLRNNPSLSMADEFNGTVQGGGYAYRFNDFFGGRFHGSVTTTSATCIDYMTAGPLSNTLAWYTRRSLAQQGRAVTLPEDMPAANLKDFCDGFAGVLMGFAASG